MSIPDYEGIERLEDFGSPAELCKYREMLLRKTEYQRDFILKHCGEPRTVIDAGCGNGRLLLSLFLHHPIVGVGVDASESRIEFARSWANEYVGASRSLAFNCAEFPTPYGPHPNFDLTLSLTGVCNYQNPEDLREWIRACKIRLKPRGKALFELYKPPQKLGRTWFELAPDDPFRFYLNNYEPLDGDDVVRHEKIFIRRNGQIDGPRVEILYYHTMPEFVWVCRDVGFKKVLWAKENSSSFVVLVEV